MTKVVSFDLWQFRPHDKNPLFNPGGLIFFKYAKEGGGGALIEMGGLIERVAY